ncbi:MAG: DUF6089 family protein [Leadbetterella sp.]
MRNFLLVCLIGISNFLNAQRLEFGAGLGPTWYKGDLQPTFRPLNPRGGANIFSRYNYNRVFSYKANGFLGMVSGNDKYSGNKLNKFRDFSFQHWVIDYNLQAEYNFLNFRTQNHLYEHDYSFYLLGGLGQSMTLSKKYYGANDQVSKDSKSSSPKLILVYGFGYKKIINNRWNLNFEFGTRNFLFKKQGEEFDGMAINPNNTPVITYAQDINKTQYTQYPNTPQKDKYFYGSITVSYLTYKVHCPPK